MVHEDTKYVADEQSRDKPKIFILPDSEYRTADQYEKDMTVIAEKLESDRSEAAKRVGATLAGLGIDLDDLRMAIRANPVGKDNQSV